MHRPGYQHQYQIPLFQPVPARSSVFRKKATACPHGQDGRSGADNGTLTARAEVHQLDAVAFLEVDLQDQAGAGQVDLGFL